MSTFLFHDIYKSFIPHFILLLSLPVYFTLMQMYNCQISYHITETKVLTVIPRLVIWEISQDGEFTRGLIEWLTTSLHQNFHCNSPVFPENNSIFFKVAVSKHCFVWVREVVYNTSHNTIQSQMFESFYILVDVRLLTSTQTTLLCRHQMAACSHEQCKHSSSEVLMK